jgi:NAD(P)H-dependent FMN reductase
MSKLLVIVGSTRPGRAADLVLPWFTERVRAHQGLEQARAAGELTPGTFRARAALAAAQA